MGKPKKYDFSGYATKVNVKCSDGRTILPNAFEHMDGKKVPFVYQHLHNDPKNVLGHAILENRKDGVYAYVSLNDTENGKTAKALIEHGDVSALSIYANGLVQKANSVAHGVIREVSLVLSGANPEAYIDNLQFAHADGTPGDVDETEAFITLGAREFEMAHDGLDFPEVTKESSNESSTKVDDISHADKTSKKEQTVGDIFDTLNEEQKTVVHAIIALALESDADDGEDDDVQHSNTKGDDTMKKNLFDAKSEETTKVGLTRDGLRAIITDAVKSQSTLKNAFLTHGFESYADALEIYEHRDEVLAHAGTYGIDNIGYLFPDARTVNNTPQFIKRDTEWVAKVFGAAKHVPFARIKTVFADITGDEARARGYVTGNKKLDEVFTLLKRTTEPQTVYKKQKLDRDDVVDITDFDVIVWLRMEMRMMLEEEIARAQLVGDGRLSSSDDKIKEDKIRPIATDDDLYTIEVQMPSNITVAGMIDKIILGRKQYKGTGTPTFFTTPDVNGDMLLLKDNNGRRIYNTESDLTAGIRAREIVEVPVMENKIVVVTPATETTDGLQKRLIGISVNMSDYSLGADKGGSISMFDDFDIDFNQFKFLIETRCSGALTMPHSAIAYWKMEVIPKTGA